MVIASNILSDYRTAMASKRGVGHEPSGTS